MSQNVQSGIEDVWTGRPAFDDPHAYADVPETIREHRKSDDRKLVVLCFECMECPRADPINDDDKPIRCDQCAYNHARRMSVARNAKGGY